MAEKTKLIAMNADFLEFLYQRFWRHLGASEEQAGCIARVISLADRQGKLYQGMGVMEALLIPVEGGLADLSAEPEIVSEGPTWIVFDGMRASTLPSSPTTDISSCSSVASANMHRSSSARAPLG